jgi:hypothetical protein
MPKYIELESAIAEMNKHGITKNMRVHKAVVALPAADVAPVVLARWKFFNKQNKAVCTNCSLERDLDWNLGRACACPNCGATMME